jgi:hypothetical protein
MRRYFIFGHIPCIQLSFGEPITPEDMKETELFILDDYKNNLRKLLDIAINWDDYQELREETYYQLLALKG